LGLVRFALRAGSRRRWKSWLVMVLLISAIGGFVMASIAAGRRTDAAFPQFIAQHGFDAAVYAQRPLPRIEQFPDVTAAAAISDPLTGQPTCDCTRAISPSDLSVESIRFHGKSPWKLVSGRLPDQSSPDQVLASFTLHQQNGVNVGTVIRVPFFSPSQGSALNAGGRTPRPKGPILKLRVVGIEASEIDFPAGSNPLDELLVTEAFRRSVLPRTYVSLGYAISLRQGEAGLPHFDAEVHRLGASAGVANVDGQVKSVEGSIHSQALGWWILAAIAALVGVAVLYQALARQTAVESVDYPSLAALGASSRQLTTLAMGRNLVVGLAGSAGAILVAFALSFLAPVGEARLAESSTGVAFDTAVLLLGALGVLVATLLLGIWPAWQAGRSSRPVRYDVTQKPSAVVARLTAAGAPPTVLIGVRHALQRKTDTANVPSGPAIVGTTLAVAVLCGTLVFGASLSHLIATPALYGNDYQLIFTPGHPDPSLLRTLENDRAVAAISEALPEDVSIDGVSMGAVVTQRVRGPFLVSTVSGHLQRGREVALGATTMHLIGAHVGSTVDISVPSPSGEKRTFPFRVGAQAAFPVLDGGVGLGTGVAFTLEGYGTAACPPGAHHDACISAISRVGSIGILTRVNSGPQGTRAVAHYLNTYTSIVEPAVAPTSLINFGQAVNFPLIVGGIVAGFGAATLLHLLTVSVSRRRRELASLKVIGFVNRQLVMTVAWQAIAVAFLGLVAGVPLGIVAGRTAWVAFAGHLGVVPVVRIPLLGLVVLAAGIVVSVMAIAVAPALAAKRPPTGPVLRSP
jgi:hypothetical protein